MRVLLITLLLAACGDNTVPVDPLFVGLSGSRIKLQWYLYQDGSRELETAAFYDAFQHGRCAAATWTDTVTRCTPLGDTTLFRDTACTMEIGHATTMRKPQFFRREELVDGERLVSHVYRAGSRLEASPTAFYELRDGTCTAIAEPTTVAYYEIGGEVRDLAEVWSEMIEGERLGLHTIAGIDNLSAPIGYHDQQLGFDCRPAGLGDGTAACVPTTTIRPDYFADHDCEVPAVLGDEPPPAIELDDPNGCTTYHGAGEAYVGFVYERLGTRCEVVGPKLAAYRIGAPLPLAPITRIREPARGKRLQRILVEANGRRTLDSRLFDTATGGECHSFGNGELAMCIPSSALDGARVYTNPACTRELLVADLPPRQCERSKFAVVEGLTIHAIGAPSTGALYVLDAFANCRARGAPRGGAVPHVLGPPVPPETFVAGVVFSER
jgi:hypothetical protein